MHEEHISAATFLPNAYNLLEPRSNLDRVRVHSLPMFFGSFLCSGELPRDRAQVYQERPKLIRNVEYYLQAIAFTS